MTLPCVGRSFPPSVTDSLTLAKDVDLRPVGLRISVVREKVATLLACGPFYLSMSAPSQLSLLSCLCLSTFVRRLAWVCRGGGHHYLNLRFRQV